MRVDDGIVLSQQLLLLLVVQRNRDVYVYASTAAVRLKRVVRLSSRVLLVLIEGSEFRPALDSGLIAFAVAVVASYELLTEVFHCFVINIKRLIVRLKVLV